MWGWGGVASSWHCAGIGPIRSAKPSRQRLDPLRFVAGGQILPRGQQILLVQRGPFGHKAEREAGDSR